MLWAGPMSACIDRCPTVEEVGAEALERLLEIERAAFRSPWSRGLLAQEFENRLSTVLGLRDAAGLQGFVVMWLVADEAHVLDVAVHPAARRRGYGTQLMEAAMARARAAGAEVMMLEVRASNEAARSLYRRLGFHEAGVRPRYYTDTREDAVVMERPL